MAIKELSKIDEMNAELLENSIFAINIIAKQAYNTPAMAIFSSILTDKETKSRQIHWRITLQVQTLPTNQQI